MRREKDFHAQFGVAQEGLHKISLVVSTSQGIVRVVLILIRIRIFRFGIAIWSVWSDVFGWGRGLNLLQLPDIYTKLCKNSQAIRDSFIGVCVAYDVPHVLHRDVLRSIWPRTATFEVNKGLIETIYRGHIPIMPSFRAGRAAWNGGY